MLKHHWEQQRALRRQQMSEQLLVFQRMRVELRGGTRYLREQQGRRLPLSLEYAASLG